MNTSESFRALRRANPRTRAGFVQSVESVAHAVRSQIVAAPPVEQRPARRRVVGASVAGASLAAVAVVAAFLTVGRGPGVETAAAAIRKAAGVTAVSAERSGTVIVRVERDGMLWAGKSVRWNGADVAIVDDAPVRPREVRELRVVDGTMYGPDGDGGWLVLGSPASIDPDSGTTPGEHLAAVREDIGGVTLRRISDAMTSPTTARLDDGSTVYRGAVVAGLIARESGFKEGQAIRVLPFGYVAHDEAADPSSPLDVAVTVGADGVVREIAVRWGGSAAWAYTVTYTGLGTTPAPVAPPNAQPLRR